VDRLSILVRLFIPEKSQIPEYLDFVGSYTSKSGAIMLHIMSAQENP